MMKTTSFLRTYDLLKMSLLGLVYYSIVVTVTGELTEVPPGLYIVLPIAFSFVFGLTVQRPSQVFEWPLCFLFGGTIGTLLMMGVLTVMGKDFEIYQMAFTLSSTFAWFGVISVNVLLGNTLGAITKVVYLMILGLIAPLLPRN